MGQSSIKEEKATRSFPGEEAITYRRSRAGDLSKEGKLLVLRSKAKAGRYRNLSRFADSSLQGQAFAGYRPRPPAHPVKDALPVKEDHCDISGLTIPEMKHSDCVDDRGVPYFPVVADEKQLCDALKEHMEMYDKEPKKKLTIKNCYAAIRRKRGSTARQRRSRRSRSRPKSRRNRRRTKKR